jgi:hypothetical protein
MTRLDLECIRYLSAPLSDMYIEGWRDSYMFSDLKNAIQA